MKKHLVLILMLISVKFFPQQNNQPPMQNGSTYNSNADKVAKYQKLQRNGIILASVGGAALIGGIALYISGAIDASNSTTSTYNNGYNNSPTIPDYAGKIIGGSALGLVGGLAVAGGIVMIKIGKRKEQRANSRVSVVVLPKAFRIAYKF